MSVREQTCRLHFADETFCDIMCDSGASPRRRADSSVVLLDAGSARYIRGSRPSVVRGETLATYAWLPTGERRANLLLVHGFRTHVRYNFLRSNAAALHQYGGDAPDPLALPISVINDYQDENDGDSHVHQQQHRPQQSLERHELCDDDCDCGEDDSDDSEQGTSSFVRELNKSGIACYGHDHLGHGESTGLRAYFPSFDALVSDIISHARDILSSSDGRGLPLFVMGHSMGGTASILAVMREPQLFSGMLLSSAASEPPKDMLGLRGVILSKISWLSTVFMPTVEVMPMPKNTLFPDMQRLYESDPFNSTVMVRARVGHEFLCAYKAIAESLHSVTVPFITLSGKRDTLVHPEASTRFHVGAASTDKQIYIQDCWHNPLTEPGREDNWRIYVDWVVERLH